MTKALPQARMEAAWRYMATKKAQAEKKTLESGNLFSPTGVSGLDNISLPSVNNTGRRNDRGFRTQLGSA